MYMKQIIVIERSRGNRVYLCGEVVIVDDSISDDAQ